MQLSRLYSFRTTFFEVLPNTTCSWHGLNSRAQFSSFEVDKADRPEFSNVRWPPEFLYSLIQHTEYCSGCASFYCHSPPVCITIHLYPSSGVERGARFVAFSGHASGVCWRHICLTEVALFWAKKLKQFWGNIPLPRPYPPWGGGYPLKSNPIGAFGTSPLGAAILAPLVLDLCSPIPKSWIRSVAPGDGQSAAIKELTENSKHLVQEYMTSSFHNAARTHIYLKFNSYNLQSKKWLIKVLIFMSKML